MNNNDFLNTNMMQSIEKFGGGNAGNVRVLVDNRVTNNYGNHPGMMNQGLNLINQQMQMIMQHQMELSQLGMRNQYMPVVAGRIGEIPQMDLVEGSAKYLDKNEMKYVGSNALQIKDTIKKEEEFVIMNEVEDVFEKAEPVNSEYYITQSIGKIYKQPNEDSDYHVKAKMIIPDDTDKPITIVTLNTNMISEAKAAMGNNSYLKVSLHEDWRHNWFKEMIMHAYALTKRTGKNHIFLIEESADVMDIEYPLYSKVYLNHSLVSMSTYLVEFHKTTDTVIFNF